MLAAGSLQICIGYSAGAAVAIHAMAQILDDDGTDEILLVDANNIQITCQEISMYIIHIQKSLEIVHLWRSRDLIPRRDNIG